MLPGCCSQTLLLELFPAVAQCRCARALHALLISLQSITVLSILTQEVMAGQIPRLTSSNSRVSLVFLSLGLIDGLGLAGWTLQCGFSVAPPWTRPPASPVVAASSRVFGSCQIEVQRLDSFFRWWWNTSCVVLWLQCSFFRTFLCYFIFSPGIW